MTVESSMPHKTSTSSVVKNAGGKAAGGNAAIMIQTCIVSFFYHYLYCNFFLMYIARFSIAISIAIFLLRSYSLRGLLVIFLSVSSCSQSFQSLSARLVSLVKSLWSA